MLERIRSRLTYANHRDGGAVHRPRRRRLRRVQPAEQQREVGQIVNGQVKSVDLAKDGTLKSAGLATINPPSGCGFQGAPADQWIQFGPATYGSVAYFRDLLGFVHLQGWAFKCGSPPSGTIFTLPKGYRPGIILALPATDGTTGRSLTVTPDGQVSSPTTPAIFLDEASFTCAPSGKNGCR